MKRLISSITIVSLIGLVTMITIRAADTATVTATVTVQNVSVSVSDGSISYGTMPANTQKSTCTSELNDAQIATNDGNITENFNIKGENSANWILAATPGTDQYVHKFASSTCSTFSGGSALSNSSYQTLATSMAPNATTTFNLQITTPNPSTVFTQQSVNVTVQAVAN